MKFTYDKFEHWITYNSCNFRLDHVKRSRDRKRVIFF